MRKSAVIAVLVALAIAVVVPSALGDATIPQANGNDFILPDGSVYQLNDDGTYSWVPNIATATAMGIDWGSLQQVVALDGPVGAPVPSVLGLANASFNRTGGGTSTGGSSVKVPPANGDDYVLPNNQVYQDNHDGTCSWIPDVATGNAMHLDWNNLVPVDTLPCDVGYPFPHVD
jgi:hypothetical protein